MVRSKTLIGTFLLAVLAATASHAQVRKIPLRLDIPLPTVAPIVAETDTTIWLHYDNGTPLYYFPLPDQYNDHYFNVRFTAPDSCRLLQAAFLFRDSIGTGVSRDLHVVVFKGSPNSLILVPPFLSPDSSALDSVIIPGDSVLVNPNWTYVDLSALDTLHFRSGDRFHVGWDPDTSSATTGIRSIWSDDGDPPTTYSCEWWGDSSRWGTMLDDWEHGVNFMLRVEIEILQDTTGVRRWLEPDRPASFQLLPPSPNPFNSSTIIGFELPIAGYVKLEVFDIMGRNVSARAGGSAQGQFLRQEWMEAGRHTFTFEGAGLSAGIYIAKLTAGDFRAAQKIVLLK